MTSDDQYRVIYGGSFDQGIETELSRLTKLFNKLERKQQLRNARHKAPRITSFRQGSIIKIDNIFLRRPVIFDEFVNPVMVFIWPLLLAPE